MVLLTVTSAAKAAIEEYCRLKRGANDDQSEEVEERLEKLSKLELGSAIEHSELIDVSKFLVQERRKHDENEVAMEWRLDTLLKGALIYRPPPGPRQEPTSEYKALMRRLRAEEEQRQYDHMLNPPPPLGSFNQRYPSATTYARSATSVGPMGTADTAEDEVTYADINRQMALIINVLVSIVACSVAIWIAARRWEVPQRLGLSMSGSGLVAAAEVAIYMGYIRRIKDAKETEVRKVEKKEVVETWVLDGTLSRKIPNAADDNVRYRKGKHR